MVDVGGAIGPLVGTWQRGHALRRVKRESVAGFALVEGGEQVFELGGQKVPVVQHLLQLTGDAGRIMSGTQVARNHHQLSIA